MKKQMSKRLAAAVAVAALALCTSVASASSAEAMDTQWPGSFRVAVRGK